MSLIPPLAEPVTPAAPASAGAATEHIVLPAPTDAPLDRFDGGNLGTPAGRWVYRTAAGEILGVVVRADTADGGKEIRCRTCWRTADGTLIWRSRNFPAPRPLYGLDRLAARPDALVIVCEGEKAADACQRIHPDAVAITAPMGAKNAAGADWSPLAGRQVLIWPDLDAPGQGYASTVAAQAQAAGAALVRIFAAERAFGAQPAGFDAADAEADCASQAAALIADERWYDAVPLPAPTVEPAPAVASAVNDASPPPAPSVGTPSAPAPAAAAGTPPAAPPAPPVPDDPPARDPLGQPLPRGYGWDPAAGLSFERRAICGPLLVAAVVHDAEDAGYGRVVMFDNCRGRRRSLVVSMAKLCTDGREVFAQLLDLGLAADAGSQKEILDYIRRVEPHRRAVTADRVGWHDLDGRAGYLLPEQPEGTLIAPERCDQGLLLTMHLPAARMQRVGSLERWRATVAARCPGNSRLVFAVSAAFAGPLLHLVGEESGGFNLRGTSSIGKSVALDVAASVMGVAKQQWRATDNGLEGLALAHNDGLLCLDELGQIEAKAAGKAAYLLANGQGKVRMHETALLRPVTSWRVLILSSGEVSLSEITEAYGGPSRAGADLRLVDVPAEAGAGFGAWECLHGAASGEAFSMQMRRAAIEQRGSAGPAYLRQLVDQVEQIPAFYAQYRDAFLAKAVSPDADGQVRRVAGRFALVAAGGEIATAFGITGWAAGTAVDAALACFRAWLRGRGTIGKAEIQKGIEAIRRFLTTHGASRFQCINPSAGGEATVHQRAGWYEDTDGERLYHFARDAWIEALKGTGCEPLLLARHLADRGFALLDGEHRPRQIRIVGSTSRLRVFTIRAAFLTSDGDGDGPPVGAATDAVSSSGTVV